jgi:hypothetical protein
VGVSRRKHILGESVIDSIDCILIKWGSPTDRRIDGGMETRVGREGVEEMIGGMIYLLRKQDARRISPRTHLFRQPI